MEDPDKAFELVVRFDRQSFTVTASATWTVERLKRELARCHSDHGAVKPSDIEVIFCGHRLSDDLKLQVNVARFYHGRPTLIIMLMKKSIIMYVCM